MQERQAVRNIDLQMVADHRETVMDISMGCIEHETRILKKARVSPLEKGLRLFLIVYLQIESLPIITLFDPPYHLLLSWHIKLHAEVRSPDGKRRFNYILNICKMVSVAEGKMAQPSNLFGCLCALGHLC